MESPLLAVTWHLLWEALCHPSQRRAHGDYKRLNPNFPFMQTGCALISLIILSRVLPEGTPHRAGHDRGRTGVRSSRVGLPSRRRWSDAPLLTLESR